MNEIYTDQTLIKYYYDECDLFTTFELEHALEHDAKLKRHYKSIKRQLDFFFKPIMPSKKAINNILAYSKLHTA